MFKNFSTLLFALTLLLSCSDSGTNPGGSSDDFDRKALLTNVADNLIIPAFKDLKAKLNDLKIKTTSFTNTPDALKLAEVRTAWEEAYKVWQHVAMFEIGKAEQLRFVNHFNIYPVTVADVENNVMSGTYDLNSTNNHDAQGFPALDYLLFGLASNDAAIVEKYATDTNASGYKKYLTDVVAKMDGMITEILNDWTTSFRSSFINSTANTPTSSLNKLVNDYIFYYEKRLRANKFGIPAGNFSTTPLPEKVEAFYRKEISKVLAVEALTAIQSFFSGTPYNPTTGSNNGESLQTYLNSLNKANLAGLITAQLDKANTLINSLDNSFHKQINDDNTQMTMAYDELQKAVVLLKVDMLQAFNISVDFVDADGD